jgi:hypothetical protein
MEIGAFFQGRSLKFQRPAGAQPAAPQPQISAPTAQSLPKPDAGPRSVA